MGIDEAIDSYQERLKNMDFSEWMRLNRMEENRGRKSRLDSIAGLMTDDD
jgi:hypothetical protein